MKLRATTLVILSSLQCQCKLLLGVSVNNKLVGVTDLCLFHISHNSSSVECEMSAEIHRSIMMNLKSSSESAEMYRL